MGDFRDLKVWAKSHALVLAVYQATAAFPTEEQYGLTNQIRRAASSIPANVAEGCGRGTDGELVRFVRIALGSANELEYHLILAADLGLLPPATQQTLDGELSEVRRMLARLADRLNTKRVRDLSAEYAPVTEDWGLETDD